jgi:hypothetical protein
MKAILVTFLFVYLSVFPSASPQPILENYEVIELLVEEKKASPDLIIPCEISLHSNFSDILILTPQFDPHPELRPPRA